MHETEALNEADRQFTICNACRYCEGLCAVFPAVEEQRTFASADLNYLANLCHSCGACYYDCQFAPPHEFAVNIPRVLAEVRNDTYKAYVWPGALAGLFERNGLAIAVVAALSITAFIIGFAVFNAPGQLFAVHTGAGAFYRLMPHGAMISLFGAAFLYALLAMAMSCRNFWRHAGGRGRAGGEAPSLWQAIKDAATLRYLDGGGVGCHNEDERPTDRRRLYHHLTFYGFLLCFAATVTGTIYHYAFGRIAPYPWWDLPPMLGKIGGVGLVIGTAGLLAAKGRRDPAMMDESRRGMDTAFVLMLFLTAATGLLLHGLRSTPLMGVMLALHLGVVFALFITMPYSKFMHGLYRFAALCRYAMSQRAAAAVAVSKPTARPATPGSQGARA